MEAVFIDIDNTLLDFDEYVKQTMAAGFDKFALKKYEPYMYDIFTEENNNFWRMIERDELTFEKLKKIRWNTIFARLGIQSDGEIFEKYFGDALNESAIPVCGAKEMLEKLSEKYIICAASNGPYFQQLHRLEKAEMKKYFDYFFISEDIGASKPSRDFYDRAFSRLCDGEKREIPPENTVMLGDSVTSDMAGGAGYKMKTCFYKRSGNAVCDFADACVSDLRRVPDIIDSL